MFMIFSISTFVILSHYLIEIIQGAYMADRRTVHIPDEHIPHFLTNGHYNAKVQAFSNDKEVVCLEVTFDLA